jgi:hypothetical protein
MTNTLINHLLAPLEVGQEVNTASKNPTVLSFVNLLVLPTLGRAFSVSPVEKFGC